MALSAAAAGLIAAGASTGGGLLGGHFNRKAQRETNSMIMQNDWDRYNVERSNAVGDRDYNNWYNSPAQQRKRLEEAGFSPHSLFGHGQIAGNSEAPRASSGTSPGGIQAPRYNEDLLSEAIGAYFNLTQTMAQTDNMRAQKEVINTDKLLKEAQIENQNTQSKLGQYDLGYRKQSAQANLKHLDLSNEKLRADINYTLDSNQRAALSNTANVAKTYKEIAMMKLETLSKYENIAKSHAERQKIATEIDHIKQLIKLSENETRIKMYHNEMYKSGMTPSDPAWMRVMIEAANNTSKTIGEIINMFK